MQGYFIQPNLWRNTLQHRLPSSSYTVSLPDVFKSYILRQTYVIMHMYHAVLPFDPYIVVLQITSRK